MEPFDLELNEQVRQLYAQIDEETVAVTTLRREAPLRAIESYTAQLAEIDSKSYVLQDDDDDIEADTPDFDINQIIPRRDTVESDFDQLVVSIREMKKVRLLSHVSAFCSRTNLNSVSRMQLQKWKERKQL